MIDILLKFLAIMFLPSGIIFLLCASVMMAIDIIHDIKKKIRK